jgi:hypothetical protein
MPEKSKTRILLENAHLYLEDVDGTLYLVIAMNDQDVWRQTLKGMAEKAIRWIVDFYPGKENNDGQERDETGNKPA